MNTMIIKTIFIMVVMVSFLIIAFITKDAVNSQLFVSLGIIAGAFALKHLSPKNLK
jgi:hypothetical protein